MARRRGPAEFGGGDGAGETVLVDDEAMIRKLVVEVLEELGYTAIEAAVGANALKILDSESRIDLLVTDVGLPTSDQRVRNRRSLHRRRHAGNKRTAACRRSTKAEAGAERAFHDRLHPKTPLPVMSDQPQRQANLFLGFGNKPFDARVSSSITTTSPTLSSPRTANTDRRRWTPTTSSASPSISRETMPITAVCTRI